MFFEMQKLTNWNLKSLGFYSLLQDDEIIEKVYHKEFSSSLVKIVFFLTLYGGITFGLWFVFHGTQFFWTWVIMAFVTFYKIFSIYLKWYLNAILMTTNNLVFVEWEGFFKKNSTRLDYWNLDEVQVMRIGIRSFLSNYGDLYFLKAGAGELASFKKASRPNKVAREIEAYREQQVDNKNFTEESALKELISSMVQSHVKVHGQPERLGEEMKEKESSFAKASADKVKVTKKFHPDATPIEVEKELDDDGGIELDLED